MKKLGQNQPIGIFDSGIGGLTVAHAIKKLMPNENFIYFGDTANLPYGDKSEDRILSYTIKIIDFLLKRNCKMIVMACNSASSVAYSRINRYVPNEIKVINTIDPVVDEVTSRFQNQIVGLIGTNITIESKIYYHKINGINNNILKELPTPKLVPMIESGWTNNQIPYDLVEEYLSHENLKNIDSLILGCTHYPLIIQEINGYYSNDAVHVLDSSKFIALEAKKHLTIKNLLSKQVNPQDKIFVSDLTPSFENPLPHLFQGGVPVLKHSF